MPQCPPPTWSPDVPPSCLCSTVLRRQRDGFRAVELHFLYAVDPREIAARLQDNGLQLVLFNAPAGGFARRHGPRLGPGRTRPGRAAGREAEFRAGVLEACGMPNGWAARIIVLCGTVPPAWSANRSGPVRDNLRWAADQAAPRGCDILIEPTNLRDVPRYF